MNFQNQFGFEVTFCGRSDWF